MTYNVTVLVWRDLSTGRTVGLMPSVSQCYLTQWEACGVWSLSILVFSPFRWKRGLVYYCLFENYKWSVPQLDIEVCSRVRLLSQQHAALYFYRFDSWLTARIWKECQLVFFFCYYPNAQTRPKKPIWSFTTNTQERKPLDIRIIVVRTWHCLRSPCLYQRPCHGKTLDCEPQMATVKPVISFAIWP